MKFISNNLNETYNLAYNLALKTPTQSIICLTGDLGVGKTHFVKGFAAGLNITDSIVSPTFTIVNEYDGSIHLNHFDVYRVNDPYEIEFLGFDDYISKDAITIIEWADLIESLIPANALWICIKKLESGDNLREIIFSFTDKKFTYINEVIK